MKRPRHRYAAHPETPADHLTEKASKGRHASANPLTFVIQPCTYGIVCAASCKMESFYRSNAAMLCFEVSLLSSEHHDTSVWLRR